MVVKQELLEENIGSAVFHDTRVNEHGLETMLIRGEFARFDRSTQNNRFYPRPIWEKQIRRLQPIFERTQGFGEADHPKDGETSVKRITHVVRKLWIEGNQVMGEIEIFPTTAGKDVMVLFKCGARLGVSSRGFGSVMRDSQGRDVVQEDFELDTFDIVAKPAMASALPEVVEGLSARTREALTESVGGDGVKVEGDGVEFKGVSLSALLESLGVEDAASEPAPAEESEEVLPAITDSELSENTRQALFDAFKQAGPVQESRSDREALEETVRKLRVENKLLCDKLKDVGYRLFLENKLRDNPDAAEIRKGLGDLMQYNNASALRERVETLSQEHAERRAAHERQLAALREEREREKERARQFEADLQRREALLAEAADTLEAQRQDKHLRVLAERRLRSHPENHVRSIRSQLDSISLLESQEQVDAIFESYRPRLHSRLETAQVAANIRMRTGLGGYTATSIDESVPSPQQAPAPGASRGYDPRLNPSHRDSSPLSELQRLMPPGIDY